MNTGELDVVHAQYVHERRKVVVLSDREYDALLVWRENFLRMQAYAHRLEDQVIALEADVKRLTEWQG